MKRHLLVNVLVSLFTSTAIAQSIPQIAPELIGVDSRRLDLVDSVIWESIHNDEIPGAVLAVVHQDKLIYLQAYGNKQIEPTKVPMTVETVFDMASCSKSMSTAIAAWQMLEQGKMRLLDPVSLYIPNFQDYRDNDGNRIVIRIVHLLAHTSGLPSYAKVDELVAKYGEPNSDGMIEYIATCKREFEPETNFQYSCLNYITLQRIIEIVSGQNLRDYAVEHIFNVLGMTHTDYNPSGETLARTAPTERQPNGTMLLGQVHDPLARRMNGGISGNAGVFSDANDIAILVTALMNGGIYNGHRILSPMAVRAMTTVPRGNNGAFGRTPGWDIFSPYASNNGDLFGPNTYGHTGYTGTSIIVDPDSKTSVILLANRVHPVDKGSVTRLRSLVANVVAGAIGCPPERVYFPYYYERVNAFKREEPITDQDIVMLGNSLTELGGNRFGQLTNTEHVRNRGIKGDVVMGVYDRLYQILPGHPKKIFLMIGVNDVANGASSEEIAGQIEQVVDRIKAESPETKLYLQSLLPVNDGFSQWTKLIGKMPVVPDINGLLKELASKKNVTFIDLFPHFTTPGTISLDAKYTDDGLHLNDEGYKVWCKVLDKHIK